MVEVQRPKPIELGKNIFDGRRGVGIDAKLFAFVLFVFVRRFLVRANCDRCHLAFDGDLAMFETFVAFDGVDLARRFGLAGIGGLSALTGLLRAIKAIKADRQPGVGHTAVGHDGQLVR